MKSKNYRHLTRYNQMNRRGIALEEKLGEAKVGRMKAKKDCTVIAVALATQNTYEVAHAALKEAGRKDGKGAKWNVQEAALTLLGFKATRWDFMEHVSKYAGWDGHGLKCMTSYHPQRKPELFEKGSVPAVIYCRTHDHAFVVMDGKTEDWSHDNYLRVKQAFVITRQD